MLDFTQIETIATKQAPLYGQYPTEITPQPAYFYLYLNGRVCADYSGEIGNARGADEWHGLTLTWRVSSYLSGQQIAHTLIWNENVRALLQRVHDGHESEWDGSNWVGRLTDDAAAAYEELEQEFQGIEPDVEVMDVGDWLFSSCNLFDHWPAGEMTLETAVNELKAEIEENQIVNGDIEEALLEDAQWKCRRLAAGLGENHLAALLEHGYADAEEIAEYRAGYGRPAGRP